jgi:hypothetical protein
MQRKQEDSLAHPGNGRDAQKAWRALPPVLTFSIETQKEIFMISLFRSLIQDPPGELSAEAAGR